MNQDEAQSLWQHRVLDYAEEINRYVATGLAKGWDEAGDAPEFANSDDLLPALLASLREANASSERKDIRAQWPLAHEPLMPLLEENAQSIAAVLALRDGGILVRLGATYEPGKVLHIDGDTITDIPGVLFFGRCPRRRFFAVAREQGVEVTDGWQGPRVAWCPWPTGQEGVPEGFDVPPRETHPKPTRLIPFPDGKRVLLVSADGTYVLDEQRAHLLLPTQEQMQEHFDWLRKNYPDDAPDVSLDMEHGALSSDGSLIAVGAQDGEHRVFDARLQCIATVGPHGEYPHHAVFSADGSMLALNACHFYNGATIGVQVDKLPGLHSDFYEDADGVKVIEGNARVYASAARRDEFILGDAGGYLRAVDTDGNARWQHFVGSTICDMDLSDDGRTLVVSTCAGYVSIIELDAGRQQPYQIGNGMHLERRRWLFWKTEPAPLAW